MHVPASKPKRRTIFPVPECLKALLVAFAAVMAYYTGNHCGFHAKTFASTGKYAEWALASHECALGLLERNQDARKSATLNMRLAEDLEVMRWIQREYRAVPRFMRKAAFRDPDGTDRRIADISRILDDAGPFKAPVRSGSLLPLPRELSFQMVFALAIAFFGAVLAVATPFAVFRLLFRLDAGRRSAIGK